MSAFITSEVRRDYAIFPGISLASNSRMHDSEYDKRYRSMLSTNFEEVFKKDFSPLPGHLTSHPNPWGLFERLTC